MNCRRWHKADRFLEFHKKLLIFESVCRRSVLFFKLTECYATKTVVWRCYEAWLLQILLCFLCGFVSLDDVNLVDMLVVDAAIGLSENSGNDDWKDSEIRLSLCCDDLTGVTQGPTVFWIAIAGLWMRRIARTCFCFCGEDQDYEGGDKHAERKTFQIHSRRLRFPQPVRN